jgi:hypothetical protein
LKYFCVNRWLAMQEEGGLNRAESTVRPGLHVTLLGIQADQSLEGADNSTDWACTLLEFESL